MRKITSMHKEERKARLSGPREFIVSTEDRY